MMKPTVIESAYKKGYRTKMIVTKISAVIVDRYDLTEKEYESVIEDVYYGNVDEDEIRFNNSYYNSLPIPKWMEEIYGYCFESRKLKYAAPSEEKLKTFTFEYPSVNGSWNTRKKPSRCLISISSDGNVSMVKLSGVNPTTEQAAAMVTAAARRSLAVYC